MQQRISYKSFRSFTNYAMGTLEKKLFYGTILSFTHVA